jgi:outer membrane lipoprotein carrier protein
LPEATRRPDGSAALVAFLLLAIVAGPAVAGEGLDRLRTFYADTQSLQADFQQRVAGPEGGVQERSSGKVWIERPNRFRWDYREPYRQLIVADGQTVKFYDPEMAQVTVRSYDRGMGHTPSMVLAGSGDLERHFRVTEEGLANGLAWVALEPRKPGEAGFQKARVGFAADPVRVRQFEFTDAFGNRTRIRFEDVRLNPGLAEGRFRFEAPAGTDVLGSP